MADAARLLGVSDDTLRRWVAGGKLTADRDDAGRTVIDGPELARLAVELAGQVTPEAVSSARNHLPGLVTRVQRDGVMAQVDVQAGPHRVVSLMSREAADELGLEPGVSVVARVKATAVSLERRHPDS